MGQRRGGLFCFIHPQHVSLLLFQLLLLSLLLLFYAIYNAGTMCMTKPSKEGQVTAIQTTIQTQGLLSSVKLFLHRKEQGLDIPINGGMCTREFLPQKRVKVGKVGGDDPVEGMKMVLLGESLTNCDFLGEKADRLFPSAALRSTTS